MEAKVILYTAVSLDGYIARKNHRLDWLFASEGEGDAGFKNFYDTVGVVVMGRKTYDQILIMEKGGWPYDKPSYVVTSSELDDQRVTAISPDKFKERLQLLADQIDKKVWIVGGGELINLCLRENLIDEMMLQVAPVIIGGGIPLFRGLDEDVNFELVGVKRYEQFAELHYIAKHGTGN